MRLPGSARPRVGCVETQKRSVAIVDENSLINLWMKIDWRFVGVVVVVIVLRPPVEKFTGEKVSSTRRSRF